MVYQNFAILCTAIFLFTASAAAKRLPPKPVPPVVFNGVSYSAETHGKDQYVAATDASKGNVLWKVKVFHNWTKFWMEEDIQLVYITNLKVTNQFLLVRDEKSRCYSISLSTRHVKKQRCDDSFK